MSATLVVAGLGGGIGSGKSTVSQALGKRGAIIIDADKIAREVCRRGLPAFDAIVDRFGQEVVSSSGELDRERLAALVFGDDKALSDLNAITHPEVGRVLLERREALERMGGVGIFDIPLLQPYHRELLRLDKMIIVDCPPEIVVSRVVESRNMTSEDVKSRIAAQMDRDKRLAMADFVVDNSGSLVQLDGEIERLWAWLSSLK